MSCPLPLSKQSEKRDMFPLLRRRPSTCSYFRSDFSKFCFRLFIYLSVIRSQAFTFSNRLFQDSTHRGRRPISWSMITVSDHNLSSHLHRLSRPQFSGLEEPWCTSWTCQHRICILLCWSLGCEFGGRGRPSLARNSLSKWENSKSWSSDLGLIEPGRVTSRHQWRYPAQYQSSSIPKYPI